MKLICTTCCLLILTACFSQKDTTMTLPYKTIPAMPDSYTPGTVVARMIDGLGFRYYWATEELNKEDLTYQPSKDTRTIGAILDHLHGLSEVIYNAAAKEVNIRPAASNETLTLQEKRKRTLVNLKKASTIYSEVTNLQEHTTIFSSRGETTAFPFWNQINGPIEDAVWHAGQVVILRRAAGNPIPKGVNVFLGTRTNPK
ncbi:MAG: hypothetical protein HKN52_11075 [Eudoraea sp.]|nr:hypothetical protein [Eudoraea sp.]